MKKLFYIHDTVENKISYWHLALFLAVLPYDYFYSELILISFGLHTLIHVKKEDVKNIFSKPVIVPVSLYIINLLAILYSANKQEGINLAVHQLGILLFPVLFAISRFNFANYREHLLSIFGLSCTATVVYLYYDALHTMSVFHIPLSSLFSVNFMNHNFSLPVGIHATYLSVYIAFSIVAFLYLLFKQEAKLNRWLYIIALVILFAGLVQLSSRAVFIAFLLIINVAIPFLLFKGRRRMLTILITSLISAAVIFFVYNVDSFKTRYVSELKTDLNDEVKIVENTEPRIARWGAIMEMVKRSPLVGYGNGAEAGLLKEKYFEKGFYISYLNEFNTHNQYLAILLRTGITGLLLFLYILYFGYASALQRKDLLLLAFMIIVTLVSVSENILDLNKGIFFYGFFFSFLLMQSRNDTAGTGNPETPVSV